MKVMCSWCQREGLNGTLGEKHPLECGMQTHGICPTHFDRVTSALKEFIGGGSETLTGVA